MPAKAKKDAETKSPETANIIATQPQSRFKEVMIFGICLIIYTRCLSTFSLQNKTLLVLLYYNFFMIYWQLTNKDT